MVKAESQDETPPKQYIAAPIWFKVVVSVKNLEPDLQQLQKAFLEGNRNHRCATPLPPLLSAGEGGGRGWGQSHVAPIWGKIS